jgi:hypothetical protein
MQVLRAGNVLARVLRFSPARIAELGAAVEQGEVIAVQQWGQ